MYMLGYRSFQLSIVGAAEVEGEEQYVYGLPHAAALNYLYAVVCDVCMCPVSF